jgi:hypothetical protein
MFRQLLPRRARDAAIRRLEGYDNEDAENQVDATIEEDDVAQQNESADGEVDQYGGRVELDELVRRRRGLGFPC